MKSLHRLFPTVLLLLLSCQPQAGPVVFTILDGEQIYALPTSERVPARILSQAGLTLDPADRILSQGLTVAADEPLPPATAYTLQIRRAVPLTLVSNGQTQVVETSALTVGQALSEAGIPLYVGDSLDPPPETPITGPMTVTHTPGRELTVTIAGRPLTIRSAAPTVGQALAEAGIPLIGLDYSLPAESDPPPADGQIRVVRVSESLVLAQKPIPFTSEFVASAEVELDQQQVLQPGEAGLAVSRTRIRYEDGQEAARQTEGETIVRPPKKRIVGYGTKIVVRTTDLGGVTIEYWRAVPMFATSYSPCRSGVDQCLPGTSSGKPVKKGVVAVVQRWYVYMQGQPVYIPGYGHATIEDVGGGIPGTPWIDLGYSDEDWVQWGDWVTVYFLTPLPADVLYVLD